MLIGIDGNEANTPNKVGVGQYAFNLLNKLNQIDNQNKYIIYLKNPPLKDLPVESSNWQYKLFSFNLSLFHHHHHSRHRLLKISKSIY